MDAGVWHEYRKAKVMRINDEKDMKIEMLKTSIDQEGRYNRPT